MKSRLTNCQLSRLEFGLNYSLKDNNAEASVKRSFLKIMLDKQNRLETRLV